MNAENLRQIAQIAVRAAIGAGNSIPALFCHTDFLIKKVSLISPNAIPANDTGLVLNLMNGAQLLASLTVSNGGQGAVGANQGKFFAVNVTDELGAPALAGSTLTLQQGQGSTDLTGAIVQIEYVRNKNN
jgi:hypothetical protein